MTLEELRAKKAEILARMRELLDLACADERDPTEEEETEYNSLETQIDEVETAIEAEEARQDRAQKLAEREAQQRQTARTLRLSTRAVISDQTEFNSLGEFLYAVRFRPADARLGDLFTEAREQSMGSGEMGGFAVPDKFRGELLSVDPQLAIFRPRATVIPTTDPPDAKLSMPTLDQTSGKNMYGGVDVQWIGEGVTKPETDAHLKEVSLEPKEVAGHIVVTDKLLRNWGAAEMVLNKLLRGAAIGAEETAFLSGNGVGKPFGITGAPASIQYTRATAGAIAYADIIGMYARLKMGGSPVWIASQTTIPQLGVIQDAASRYIYVESAAAGMPPTLLGYPVLYHDRSPALGSTGDLVLADLSYYLIHDGSGPFVMASEHVYFTSNKTVIKIFWNVDGKPWLSGPIPLEGSSSNTVSPFIILV